MVDYGFYCICLKEDSVNSRGMEVVVWKINKVFKVVKIIVFIEIVVKNVNCLGINWKRDA